MLIRQNILPQIGVKVVQDKPAHDSILNIHEKEERSDKEIKSWVRESSQKLWLRNQNTGKREIKTPRNANSIPTKFYSDPAKRPKDPIHLQERVEAELIKLIDQKRIKKIDKCSINKSSARSL